LRFELFAIGAVSTVVFATETTSFERSGSEHEK
jgi:hypothetical protein